MPHDRASIDRCGLSIDRARRNSPLSSPKSSNFDSGEENGKVDVNSMK